MRVRIFLLCSIFSALFLSTTLLRAQADPNIFIAANDGFGESIAAAFVKKKVPATVVSDRDHAAFVLKATAVNSRDETGAGKIARCMFLSCAGMNGFSSVSVELIRTKDTAVVWAYQVRKSNSGPVAIQSLSEAVAKHLKNDYLNKRVVERRTELVEQ